MIYAAHVENGSIVVDGPENPPEGAKLEIHVVSASSPDSPRREPPWLKYFGAVKNLPPDASQRIDEVLYGPPQQ
jgi:hypothetical protein